MSSPDVAVIGSGPGGYRAAVLAALRGLKVVIVERQTWGGTCLNRGCVPKKAWYHSACVMDDAARFGERGLSGTLGADFPRAWQHQRRVVETVRGSYVDYLGRLGIRMLEGDARFEGPQTLRVNDQLLQARNIVIATGSQPWLPAPLQRVPQCVLTTDDLFDHPPPPGRRVALLGSGFVGTEMAFILSRLGLEVIWLTGREPLSSSAFSAPARAALREALAQAGVRPRLHSRIAAVGTGDAGVTLTLADGERIVVDWVLAGTGRRPRTDGLDLARAGVALGAEGHVRVDEYNRAAPGIYAIGDVANPGMSANHALADAAVAVSDMLEPGRRRRADEQVPQVLYSALELARVGLNEDQAEALEFEPAAGFASFDFNPAALAAGERGGFLRLLADLDSGRALGAEIAGRGAGELISLLGLEFGTPQALSRLAAAAYNHPARAEEILNAVETLAARWGMAAQVFAPSPLAAGRE
ncbi:MAG: NAD(P)/FAD-dependent oxidoreductase [Burkholderiales bacterium]|jgi:dihydrolipoamide dehydrogenase|nr:NAD(P)/FAD-dependent oxidoreductase [Burkholderiales bacterium]